MDGFTAQYEVNGVIYSLTETEQIHEQLQNDPNFALEYFRENAPATEIIGVAENSETNDTKSVSAKTITLRSNGTAKSVEETEGDRNKGKEVKEIADQQPTDPKEIPEDEAQAATKIQAAFRGHKTRKSMKQPANKVSQAEPEPTQQQLEEEFRLDDPELCNAATKIQASFRGHMTRKHEAEAKKTESSSSKDKMNQKADEEEELDIDLSDPELNKAAVKIQASFRGHMVRKDNEGETTTAN